MSSPSYLKLEGVITKVIFPGFRTGARYSIVELRLADGSQVIKVKGDIGSADEQSAVVVLGSYAEHETHGAFFDAKMVYQPLPSSGRGLDIFLRTLPGIGEVKARKLIQNYGEGAIGAIESAPGLGALLGLDEDKVERLRSVLKAKKLQALYFVDLFELGLSERNAVAALKIFGASTLQTIRDNPYILALRVAGIGFKSADAVALQLGITGEDPRRLRAAVHFAYKEDSDSSGSTVVSHWRLARSASMLTGVSSSVLSVFLEQDLVSSTGILERDWTGVLSDGIIMRSTREMESYIGDRLVELALAPPIADERLHINFESITEGLGFTLEAAQREAVLASLSSRFLVITGGPGVGKSTVLKATCLGLRAAQIEYVLLSPTGRAAKRLSNATGYDAQTLHKYLGLIPGTEDSTDFQRKAPSVPTDENDTAERVYIIDEASMLDLQITQRLLQHCEKEGFNRISLILVGDTEQLPSVGAGQVLGDVVKSGVSKVCRLTQIYRQAADSGIIAAAHAFNKGEIPDLCGDFRTGAQFAYEGAATEEAASKVVEEIVRANLDLVRQSLTGFQVLTPVHKGPAGTIELNKLLHPIVNPAAMTQGAEELGGFFEGDKVLFLKNNYELGFRNGELGLVLSVNPYDKKLTVRKEDGDSVELPLVEMDSLRHGYAISVHKSQGSEFQKVVLVGLTSGGHGFIASRNLYYTGITRGKEQVIFVGEYGALERARNKPVERCTTLKSWLMFLAQERHELALRED